LTALLAGAFLAAALFAGAFFATAYFATRFAGAFFAAVRLAGAFFAAARFAGAFLAGAFLAAALLAGAFLAAAFLAGAFFAAVMRCASSAADVDELLRRCDQVDDARASTSTRRAVSFLRAIRAATGTTKRVNETNALIPLRRRAFMFPIVVRRCIASTSPR
jgi:uncharacterized protein YjbI with pentapeptide repeats